MVWMEGNMEGLELRTPYLHYIHVNIFLKNGGCSGHSFQTDGRDYKKKEKYKTSRKEKKRRKNRTRNRHSNTAHTGQTVSVSVSGIHTRDTHIRTHWGDFVTSNKSLYEL